ncbi:uncharacterized protein LOC141889091 isoform X2 [Acropora palmata]|uniref:uncharacterized protein LOC141889091 isoform X2 n=1 Tax=Acropora palmata TaxID=6131 RepID=UPI003DA177D0
MFTSGMLAQKCEAAFKALIAGIATQVNLDGSRLRVALACINECKRGDYTFDKEMAQCFGSHLKLQMVCLRKWNACSCSAEETFSANK